MPPPGTGAANITVSARKEKLIESRRDKKASAVSSADVTEEEEDKDPTRRQSSVIMHGIVLDKDEAQVSNPYRFAFRKLADMELFLPDPWIRRGVTSDDDYSDTYDNVIAYTLNWYQKIFVMLDYPNSCQIARIYHYFNIAIIATVVVTSILSSFSKFQFIPETCLNPICKNEPLCEGREICTPEPYPRILRIIPRWWDEVEMKKIVSHQMEEPLYGPVEKFLRYGLSVPNLIDFLSTIPFFIVIGNAYQENPIISNPWEYSSSSSAIMAVRVARCFRLLKVLDIHPQGSPKLSIIIQTVRESFSSLAILLGFVAISAVILGSLIFAAERGTFEVHADGPVNGAYYRYDITGDGKEVSPFTNLGACIYWAMVTMSTLGYGDMYPTTAIGRLIGTVGAIYGVLAVSLPVTIINNAFSVQMDSYTAAAAAEKRRLRLKKKFVTVARIAGNKRLKDLLKGASFGGKIETKNSGEEGAAQLHASVPRKSINMAFRGANSYNHEHDLAFVEKIKMSVIHSENTVQASVMSQLFQNFEQVETDGHGNTFNRVPAHRASLIAASQARGNANASVGVTHSEGSGDNQFANIVQNKKKQTGGALGVLVDQVKLAKANEDLCIEAAAHERSQSVAHARGEEYEFSAVKDECLNEKEEQQAADDEAMSVSVGAEAAAAAAFAATGSQKIACAAANAVYEASESTKIIRRNIHLDASSDDEQNDSSDDDKPEDEEGPPAAEDDGGNADSDASADAVCTNGIQMTAVGSGSLNPELSSRVNDSLRKYTSDEKESINMKLLALRKAISALEDTLYKDI